MEAREQNVEPVSIVGLDCAENDPLFTEGLSLLDEGNHPEARKGFKECLCRDPKRLEVSYCLGLACYGVGKLDETRECFEKTITLNKGFATAHFHLGLRLKRLGKHRKAADHFHRAASLGASPMDALLNLAYCALRDHDPGSAREVVLQMVNRDPGDNMAWFNLGVAYMGLEFRPQCDHGLPADVGGQTGMVRRPSCGWATSVKAGKTTKLG